MNEQEQWRDIPGYEGLYRVSDQGRIWSYPRPGSKGGFKNPRIQRRYLCVTLHRDGHPKTRSIHCLVMLAFVGPKPTDHQVDHIDSNRLNNHLSNLRYLHHSINEAQGVRKIHDKFRGEDHPFSKLTNQQRFEIAATHSQRKTLKLSLTQIAKPYGIAPSYVTEIARKVKLGKFDYALAASKAK